MHFEIDRTRFFGVGVWYTRNFIYPYQFSLWVPFFLITIGFGEQQVPF